MTSIALRTFINAVALWLAASIVPGIHLSSSFWGVLFVAILFGIVNALIKPLAIFLSLPAIVLTIGLFTIVVNAAMLGLTASLTGSLDIDGFWSAAFGAIIISLVSWGLSAFIDDEKRSDRHFT